MKILFVVNTYYPLNDGVQSVTAYQAEGLASRGHSVSVVTPKWNCQIEEEEHNGVTIYRYPVSSSNGLFFGDKKGYVKDVVEKANNSDIIVVVAIQAVASDLIIANLDKITAPKVLYVHGIWDFSWHRKDMFPPQKILYKIWANLRWSHHYSIHAGRLRKFDAIINLCKSDSGYQFFEKRKFNHSYLIANAVRSDFFEEEVCPFDLSEYGIENRFMLNISNFGDGKNQAQLLDIFYSSEADLPQLVLIGRKDGTSYYDNLVKQNQKLAKINPDKKVLILENIDNKYFPYIMRKAELFLFPSKAEKQPVILREVMASGLPYVTTDVGDARELCGGLVADNWNDFMVKTEQLIAAPELLEKLGNEGRERAQGFMISAAVDSLEKILEEACKR